MENNKIQFKEQQYRTKNQQAQNSFIDFLIKKGLANDKKQATYLLFGVIVVCVLVAIWFFSGKDNDRKFTETEIKVLEQAGSSSEIINY